MNRARGILRGIFVLSLLLFISGCGYRVKSSMGSLPSGVESLGIPTFINRSPQFKLEQRISGAVLGELTARTPVPVNSSSTGVDAVLRGEIRSVSTSPVTFGSDTFGSAFLITVQMSVKLVRVKDSKILWENANFLFRERYVLNNKLSDFFSEENPALDRMSHDFAASLVSAILNR
jgi:hypothetical protein